MTNRKRSGFSIVPLAFVMSLPLVSWDVEAQSTGRGGATGAGNAAPPRSDAAVARAEAAAERAEAATKEAQSLVGGVGPELAQQRNAALLEIKNASAEMIARAQFVEWISTKTVWFVSLASLVAGLFGAIGFKSISGLDKKRTELDDKTQAVGAKLVEIDRSIVTIEQKKLELERLGREAQEAVAAVEAIKKSLESQPLSLQSMETKLDGTIQSLEREIRSVKPPDVGLIGSKITESIPQSRYDEDVFVVLADRLGLVTDNAKLVTILVSTSRYWRRKKQYELAIERARRARDLDPKNPRGHIAYARALWNRFGDVPGSVDRAQLHDALVALSQARTILATTPDSAEPHYDTATVQRYLGDYEAAEQEYRLGMAASDRSAKQANREPDWDLHYALACLLAKQKRFKEAFELLNNVSGRVSSWSDEDGRSDGRSYKEWIREDDDLAQMRSDSTWGPQLLSIAGAPSPAQPTS